MAGGPRVRPWALGALALAVLLVAAWVVTGPLGGGGRRGLVATIGGSPGTAAPTTGPGGGATTSTALAQDPTTAPPSTGAVPAGRPLEGRTVAVDPGHNGRNGTAPKEINREVDAGGFQKACNTTGTATARGIDESAVNWAVALEVQARLQALGATVVLTRQDDNGVGPCIDERAAVANRARADVLLSIHADGAAPGSTGFHVIRPGLVKGYTEDIVGSSSTLATAVRDALVAGGLRTSTYAGRDGLVTRTDLGTLNRSDVPACMAELGNLRNPGEAVTLTSPAGQAKAAAALVAGVEDWLRRPPAERTGPPPAGAPSPPGTGKE